MGKTNLKGLQNFKKRLEKYTNNDYKTKILNAILSEAQLIARKQYSGINDINIYTKQFGNGGQLVVEGSQVLYIEFGYGYYAKGTYEGTLPTSGIKVTKSGGWEYYYDNTFTKRYVNGQFGWFHRDDESGTVRFEIGENAGNQMYRVAKELSLRLPEIVKGVK